jgi:hypothetical protein
MLAFLLTLTAFASAPVDIIEGRYCVAGTEVCDQSVRYFLLDDGTLAFSYDHWEHGWGLPREAGTWSSEGGVLFLDTYRKLEITRNDCDTVVATVLDQEYLDGDSLRFEHFRSW